MFHYTVSCKFDSKCYIAMSVAGRQTIRSLGVNGSKIGYIYTAFSLDGEVRLKERVRPRIIFYLQRSIRPFSSCFFSA